jgi:hypothetical protein
MMINLYIIADTRERQSAMIRQKTAPTLLGSKIQYGYTAEPKFDYRGKY